MGLVVHLNNQCGTGRCIDNRKIDNAPLDIVVFGISVRDDFDHHLLGKDVGCADVLLEFVVEVLFSGSEKGFLYSGDFICSTSGIEVECYAK